MPLCQLLCRTGEVSHTVAAEVGMLLPRTCRFSQRADTQAVGESFKAPFLSLGNVQ